MVYTVIPYRLPQRPRWGLPRAVGIDSSGVRGQRPSQPEESGGFCLSISRTGNFVTTAPDELILSKQDPSLGLSWTNTGLGNTEIRTQTRKASGCSPVPRRLGSPVGDGGRGGERVPLRSPLRLVWASGKVPDGHRPSRRSVPGTGPARPLRTPLAPGNSASFPEWLRVRGGEVF